jgi:hypothetical protein
VKKGWCILPVLKNILIFIFIISILLLPNLLNAVDRCDDFVIDVRNQHIKYFGPDYPWWYGIGQLRQESNCRTTVTAFDAGMGIAQFMPATHKYIENLIGDGKLDPYNFHHAIRMQAFYMSILHKQNKFSGKPLCYTYQAYNGGWKLLYTESARANSEQWIDMKNACQRRKIKLKCGSLLDFCDVNYDYSIKVWKYGNKYRTSDDIIKYW